MHIKLKIFKANRLKGLRLLKLWNWQLVSKDNGKLIASVSYPYHNRLDCIDNLIAIRDSLNAANLERLRTFHQELTELNID